MEQTTERLSHPPDPVPGRRIDAAGWRLVCSLFERAVDLPPKAREAFLSDRSGDAAARRIVRRMLEADRTPNALDLLGRSLRLSRDRGPSSPRDDR